MSGAAALNTALAELNRELHQLRVGGPPACEVVVPALRAALDMNTALAYEVERVGESVEARVVGSAGLVSRERAQAAVDLLVGGRPSGWGFFDPSRPEPRQRNRATSTPSVTKLTEPSGKTRMGLARKLGLRGRPELVRRGVENGLRVHRWIGVHRSDQLRILVCDGPQLLAWVGGYREEPMGALEERALQALAPALSHRLTWERRLSDAGAQLAALLTTLEWLGGPAFIVSASGAIRHLNSAARALLDRQPGLRLEVRDATLRGGDGRFQCVPISAEGVPRQHLLLLRPQPGSVAEAVERATVRWGLTPRQAQVLERLAQGESNKAIAATLGCAVHTVELHVSAILVRAQVPSRAALVVALGRLA